MRLVQILGECIEELWEFDEDIKDEQITEFYKEYQESEYELFDEFMEEQHPEVQAERKFVDEVYI